VKLPDEVKEEIFSGRLEVTERGMGIRRMLAAK